MSKFRLISIGTVSEPKETPLSLLIQVKLDEIHPFTDGDVISSEEKYTVHGEDRLGRTYSASISADKVVTATWLREGNRVTAPDVERGEKVGVYRNDNDENFYWKWLGVGDTFQRRKQETIVIAIAADGSTDEKTQHTTDNCYTLTISGHKKVAVLDMPKVAGAKGHMRITLDQESGIINSEIIGVSSIKQSSDGYINASINGGAELDMNQGDITLKFDSIKLEGSKAEFNIGKTNWAGDANHKGNFTNTGKMTSNNVSVDKHEHPVVGSATKAPIPGT